MAGTGTPDGRLRAKRRRQTILLLLIPLFIAGCSSRPVLDGSLASVTDGYPEPVFSAQRVLSDDVVDPLLVHDPWHGANRWIYGPNASIAQLALNPRWPFRSGIALRYRYL